MLLRRVKWALQALVLAAVAIAWPIGAAAADENTPPATLPWQELSVGGSAGSHSWSLYSSSTLAPMGSLGADGVRVRLGGGYGRFDYAIPPHLNYACGGTSHICPAVPVKGRVTFGDILVGYQVSYGRFTAKAFAGLAIDTQALSPWDPDNAAGGRATGFKAVIETWTNITPALWTSIDGSWTDAHDGHALQARLGYRLSPALSIGLEEGKVSNVAGHQFRSGLFARLEWESGEAVLAGGLANEHFDYPAEHAQDKIWASLNVLFRY